MVAVATATQGFLSVGAFGQDSVLPLSLVYDHVDDDIGCARLKCTEFSFTVQGYWLLGELMCQF